MKSSKHTNGAHAEDLCLACGLCCDGVIFVDVKLQPGDDPMPLLSLGSPLLATRATEPPTPETLPQLNSRPVPFSNPKAPKFPQPCFAFDGCKCQVYSQRPKHCREFECLLLRRVREGRTPRPEALQTIRTARHRADTVWRLLRELGDIDENSALSVRFRRTAKRMEQGEFDKETTALYGELTLAVHDLNCLLSEAFYPR